MQQPILAAVAGDQRSVARAMPGRASLGRARSGWPALAAPLFFGLFFIAPVAFLFLTPLDKSVAGSVTFQGDFNLANLERIFTRPLYYDTFLNSFTITAVVALSCLVLKYPLAFLIARTQAARPCSMFDLSSGFTRARSEP